MEEELNLEIDRRIVVYDRRRYPCKLSRDESLKLYLEDSLKLVENPPNGTKELKLHLDGYLKIRTVAHGQIFYGVKLLDRYLLNSQNAPFLRKWINGEFDVDGDPSLEVNPLGSVKYKGGWLFYDSLLFKGRGDLEIDPKKNLEKLASYYRLKKD